VSPRSLLVTRGLARRLAGVPFDPPLYDTFAFIARRGAHLAPATRAFIALAERRVQALGRRLEADAAAEAAAREGA
jgi:hypothetical protein